MSQKVFSLISFVLVLCLAGNTLAAVLTWDNDGGLGDRLWSNAANWDKTGPASAPTAGDTVVIDDLFTDAANGPIIQSPIDAECSALTMGDSASPAVEAVLTMTGGTLTTGGLVSLGDTVSGDYKFDLIDGSVTIGGRFALGYATGANVTFNMDANDLSITDDLFLGVQSGGGSSNTTFNINGGHIVIGEDIELAEYQGASATINISDGVVEVGDNIYVGWSQTGTAIFNMTGGTVTTGTVTGDWIYIGGGYGPDSILNLEGGTLYAPGISLYPDTTFNVAGGTFIVDGDYVTVANGWIWDPCAGDWTGTLASPGVMTVYGTDSGDIITDGNYPAQVGRRAVLIIDYDERNPGQTTVTAGAVDPNKAWDPIPTPGSVVAKVTGITISWLPGEKAASHEVYFGTSYADVNDANTSSDPNIYRGSGSVAGPDGNNRYSYTVPETLMWDKKYYWRIDEVNNPTPPWKGLVWSIVIPPAKALNPYPDDGAGDVSINVVLGWTPGAEVDTHEVYFSTDFNDVNNRDAGALTVVGPNYHYPGPLNLSTPYYWAVDEVNLSAVVPRWYGDIWSFTTDDHITLDDFDSYADDAAIKAVWKDYWFNTGSKNGAQVFVEADPGLVRDGQSMKYWYKNYQKVGGKYVGSWAEAATADLGGATDWAFDGTRALVLYFYGDPCNGKDTTSLATDQMYVEVEDSGTNAGIVKYPDMNAVTEDWWHEWDIDLQDAALSAVDVNNVAKVYIGFGGNAKTGQTDPGAGMTYGYSDTVYFEDIEVWPPWCKSELVPTDFSGDCITDYEDVDIMGRDWLMYDYNTTAATPDDANLLGWWQFDDGSGTKVVDSSAYDNDGNYFGGNPSWVTGHTRQTGDYAMYFDGQGEHVICETRDGNGPGTYDANLMPDVFTIACWTKLSEFVWFSSFVSNGIDTGSNECGFFLYNFGWEPPEDGEDFGLAIRIDGETGMTYVETPSIYQIGRWYHLAATYDGQYVNIYVDGEPAAGPADVGGPILWVSPESGNYPESFVIGAWLDVGYFLPIDGAIDDVRFYDYALPQGEVAVLAGIIDPGVEYYQPVPSLANITDPEAKFFRKVNFRDFVILADHWLEGPILWPQ